MNCEKCKNRYMTYLCPLSEEEIEDRTPCSKYKEIPKGITSKELIKILEKLPQDMEIKIECEGLFAVTGATYEDGDNEIFLSRELIAW